MEKQSTPDLNEVSYNDKKDFYEKNFSIGHFGSDDLNDKLILISLLSLTYIKLKEKNPKIKPLDILLNITKESDKKSYFYQTLESISILVEDFCYDCKKSDACGLKSSKEIINKIKEILDSWTPF